MKFSQRIGKSPISKPIQIDGMDADLRNGLWNVFQVTILNNLAKETYGGRRPSFKGSSYHSFCKSLWHNFFKEPIDRIPDNWYSSEETIREFFFKSSWFRVYDFLEFTSIIQEQQIQSVLSTFRDLCNGVLEREFAGYRFIGETLSPITNETEIEEIANSLVKTNNFTSLKGANLHLTSALHKLSDRKNPDYRNSIKESISAIESIAKVISDDPKDSLGGALAKIKGKIKLHPSLERGFKQIYGYTSDSDGIRHALTEAPNTSFEDAKFMLVSCSAFLNYLIVKADKAGIPLK